MKVHILFPLKERPSGGGNQFLLALRQCFVEFGCYEAEPEDADCILFNSYPFGAAAELYARVARIRRQSRRAITVVHRVDGPIAVVRGSARHLEVDRSIAAFNHLLADATVFQSQWSRSVCRAFGIGSSKPETVICNAPDARSFFPPAQPNLPRAGERVRLIATSWSSNWRKGFDIYRFLDQALDHGRYELTIIGNVPVSFSNASVIPALGSRELGEQLRAAHIYLAASVDDPCSNALLEALHCGLPVVARASGGHSELIGASGTLFRCRDDVLAAIDRVAESLGQFPLPQLPTIEAVAHGYLDFASKVCEGASATPVKQPTGKLISLWAGVCRQRYWSGFTRTAARLLPLREACFYDVPPGFRRSGWDCPADTEWTLETAREWVADVLARLPLFLDSMRHPATAELYRFSQSGDLQPQPSLAASVFVAKIMTMARLLDAASARALTAHILSFQGRDGAITDPWIAAHSRRGRLADAIRSRSIGNVFNVQTVRAETRQAFAALRALGAMPPIPFSEVPRDTVAIEAYIRSLNWDRPWSAASHVSHLAFFMTQHCECFGIGQPDGAAHLLARVEKDYRREDGAWYAPGARISIQEKVNGAMKMVTALDAAGVADFTNAEGLIDICLAAANDGHACNHFNVICVLHRCSALTDYRANEVRQYMLDRLYRFGDHYWPWQGGFSFFPGAANHAYYNARVTTGMAEPDVHGTVLFLWGIVLVCEALGWAEEFKLQRPLT